MTLTEADRQRMAEGGVSYGEESPGRSVWMAQLLKVDTEAEWPTDVAAGISTISKSGYWAHIKPSTEVITTICENLDLTNGVRRYDGATATWNEKRWWTECWSANYSPKGEKDMIR